MTETLEKIIQVLVIDDEAPVRTAIRAALRGEQIQADSAADAKEALALLEKTAYDVILLDVLMPGTDGFSLLKTLRENGIFTPVILLSGLAEDSSMVKGYGLGADDYVIKPFSKTVLVSKIRALLRRTREYTAKSSARPEIVCGDLLLRLDTQTAQLSGKELSLSSKEFAILCRLASAPGETISKEQLYQEVWNSGKTDNAKILVYINRIRDKLEEDPSSPKRLVTDWGKGYHLNP